MALLRCIESQPISRLVSWANASVLLPVAVHGTCGMRIKITFFFTETFFFNVFNNILNILNLCIDLLSLLRNCED